MDIIGLTIPISKKLYEEVHKKIERGTERIYFALIKITIPFVMFPSIFLSFTFYMFYDMDRDAFYLTFPMW